MPTIQVESSEFCSCGNHDNLVVMGVGIVYIGDNLAWVAECFECNEKFWLGDEARDEIFGTGWREGR